MRPFDQRVIAPMQRPSTEDLNSARSAEALRLSWFYQQLLARMTTASNPGAFYPTGFLGAGFRCVPTSPATLGVQLSPGLGFYYDDTTPLVIAEDLAGLRYEGVTDLSPYHPLVLDATLVIPIQLPLPPPGQSRYDLIEVRPKRELTDYGQVLRWNTAGNQFTPDNCAAFLRYAVDNGDLGYVPGNTAGPSASVDPVSCVVGPAAVTGTQLTPQGSPGYVPVARILVSDSAVTILGDKIADQRHMAQPGGIVAEVECTVGTAAVYKPVILQYDAAPGIVLVPYGLDRAEASMALYVLGPQFTSMNMQVQCLAIGDSNTNARIASAELRYINTDPVLVDASIQTAVADAARTPNPQAVGIGSRFRRFNVRTRVQSGATQTDPNADGNFPTIRYLVSALVY